MGCIPKNRYLRILELAQENPKFSRFTLFDHFLPYPRRDSVRFLGGRGWSVVSQLMLFKRQARTNSR